MKLDATLNSADLGTKFHPAQRFDKLLMMFLLRIGVGLVTGLGAEGHRTERGDGENRDASLTSYLSVRDGSPVAW